ncbi:MAG: divalent-cation tolerance protein CutA [Alphaproteobacteria bacterium]|nr:divalent-cation tolerance protein CutA [Alphaproteobacteria bacterium]
MGSNPAAPTILKVMMMSQLSLLYTTFSTEEDALHISQKLLETHLVACMNLLGPMRSFYFWEGRLKESREVAVLLKTIPEKVPEVMSQLQKLHPYDIPVILEIPISRANEIFQTWAKESMR